MNTNRRIPRMLDLLDYALCKAGLLRPASFDTVLESRHRALYAGKLRRSLPQFETHIGLTPFFASTRNIPFDATEPLPLPDGSIARYQSEDVFEHVPLDKIVEMFNEIHRVLQPGGLFRLSLPDYNFDGYRDRSQRDEAGRIVFDFYGGGQFVEGSVTDGGHLWFPDIDLVRDLFAQSAFADDKVEYLHFTQSDGRSVLNKIDYAKGYVQRTPDHDSRSQNPRRAQSIVVDAWKR